MRARNGAGVTHRVDGADARGIDQLGGKVNFLATPDCKSRLVIRAELLGSNVCTALGMTVRAAAPVLTMCRKLLAVGVDPGRPMHVYRGGTLSLWVSSIGERGLEINSSGTGFIKHRPRRRTVPLVRKSCPVRPRVSPMPAERGAAP